MQFSVMGIVFLVTASLAPSADAAEPNRYIYASLSCGDQSLKFVIPIKDETILGLNEKDKATFLFQSKPFQDFVRSHSIHEILDCYWSTVQ
jgi:hypothetical protein